MKFFRSIPPRWVLLTVLLGALAGLTGCATPDQEPENMSERPWNTPKSWENGLPGGMMEGH